MHVKNFVCVKCGKKYPPKPVVFICQDSECRGSFDIEYDYAEIKKLIIKDEFRKAPVSHWKYWPFYPISDLSKVITLNEGNTPLLQSKNNRDFLFKCEAFNPTGSFKDRGSTIEISKAMEFGVKTVICASSGNMGASLAAYAARGNILAKIYVPKIAPELKVKQIKAHGAEVITVDGDYTMALNKTLKLRREKHIYLTGDYPFRGEGEKSVGFEIIDNLEWQIPENVVCPVGNGTLLYGVAKAFKELKLTGFIKKIPKVIGVQAEKCNPLVKAFKEDSELVEQKNPDTIATAIACGMPVDGMQALSAIRESGGTAESVTEKEIISAVKELGREGIYAEPAGAVAFAGAKKLELKGTTAIVVSGHGLKSPLD